MEVLWIDRVIYYILFILLTETWDPLQILPVIAASAGPLSTSFSPSMKPVESSSSWMHILRFPAQQPSFYMPLQTDILLKYFVTVSKSNIGKCNRCNGSCLTYLLIAAAKFKIISAIFPTTTEIWSVSFPPTLAPDSFSASFHWFSHTVQTVNKCKVLQNFNFSHPIFYSKFFCSSQDTGQVYALLERITSSFTFVPVTSMEYFRFLFQYARSCCVLLFRETLNHWAQIECPTWPDLPLPNISVPTLVLQPDIQAKHLWLPKAS